jgi:hypothetical protein
MYGRSSISSPVFIRFVVVIERIPFFVPSRASKCDTTFANVSWRRLRRGPSPSFSFARGGCEGEAEFIKIINESEISNHSVSANLVDVSDLFWPVCGCAMYSRICRPLPFPALRLLYEKSTSNVLCQAFTYVVSSV